MAPIVVEMAKKRKKSDLFNFLKVVYLRGYPPLLATFPTIYKWDCTDFFRTFRI